MALSKPPYEQGLRAAAGELGGLRLRGDEPPHGQEAGPCLRIIRQFLQRLYEKSSNTSESPRHEADHASVHQRLPARTQPLVVFAQSLLCWSIHESVRSTTHLLGNTTKPLGGNRLRQSTATPSLAHSLAHLIST